MGGTTLTNVDVKEYYHEPDFILFSTRYGGRRNQGHFCWEAKILFR